MGEQRPETADQDLNGPNNSYAPPESPDAAWWREVREDGVVSQQQLDPVHANAEPDAWRRKVWEDGIMWLQSGPFPPDPDLDPPDDPPNRDPDPMPPPDPAAIAFEQEVRQFMDHERAKREGRRRLDAEARGATVVPDLVSLAEWLKEPAEEVRWRIEGWQPCESYVLLAAQYKAGKTTLVDNLVRSLVDGDPFLGQAAVAPIVDGGTVAVIDAEMSEKQLREWFREQKIQTSDRVCLVALRGRVSTLDLLNPTIRAEWAARLQAWNVKYVILDCLRPVLDVLGLDEHRDVGRFLVAWNALLLEAGIPESAIVHHMGHEGNRARGDSRLRDWPDVEWRLTREGDDPAGPRSLTAYGRDVEVPSAQLVLDPDTRRLTLGEPVKDSNGVMQQKREKKSEQALGVLVRWLHKGQHVDLSGRKIKEGLYQAKSGLSEKTIDAALIRGVETGDLVSEPGPKNATFYRVAPQSAIAREHDELQAAIAPRRTET